MICGIVGFIAVSAAIFAMVPKDDNIAEGYAFVFLITVWWGYFVVAAAGAWLFAGWLKDKSIWLLVIAPVFALWFLPKIVQTAVLGSAVNFFTFTMVAVLPVLLGASAYISKRNSPPRPIKSVKN